MAVYKRRRRSEKGSGAKIQKGIESKNCYFPFTLWEISLKDGVQYCHIEEAVRKQVMFHRNS
jgi:hypothetical protein